MRIFSNSPLSWSGDSSDGKDCIGKSSDEGFVEQLSPDLDILPSFNNCTSTIEDDDVAAMDMYWGESLGETLDELISYNSLPYQNDDILDFIDFAELEHIAENKGKLTDSELISELMISERVLEQQSVAPAQMIVDFQDDDIKSEPCSPLAPAVPTELVIVREQKNSQQLSKSSPVKLAKVSKRKVPNIQPKLLYRPLVKNAVSSTNNTTVFNSISSSTANLVHSPPHGASTTVVVLDAGIPQASMAHHPFPSIKVNAVKTTPIIAPSSVAITSQTNVISASSPTKNNVLSPVLINTPSSTTMSLNNIDYRMFKQQQRKIKNRESACLSRKKKKDYVTLLENQVNDLTAENNRLREENALLKENLHRCENIKAFFGRGKNFKKGGSVALCIFLFMVGFQFNSIRTPSLMRHQHDLIKDKWPESKALEHQANGRNLLWIGDLTENGTTANSNFMSLSTMCPAAINQTESARLVFELERLIANAGGASYDNVMMPPSPVAPSVELPLPYKNRSTRSSSNKRRKPKPKKYVRLDDSNFHRKKSHRADEPSSHYLLSYERYVNSRNPTRKLHQRSATANGELQVFAPSRDQLYGEFFEAINRQDDTFYVVSFSDHHMLLPALYHNKTRRPKMSLIMPSMLQNDNNSSQPTQMPLMQIDCEVLDTRLLQVNYGSIPQHLRSSPSGNTTTSPTTDYHNHHPDDESSETVTSGNSKEHETYGESYLVDEQDGGSNSSL